MLNWSTKSESNSSHFEIQNSEDGIVWNTIGQVSAAGNSDIEINYSFTHYEPLSALSYYRMKQIDFNGDFKYSSSILFDKGSENSELSVLSNGTSPIIFVDGKSDLQIKILNMIGEIVWDDKLLHGDFLNLGFLPRGHYFVRGIAGNKLINKKVIVMK